MKRCNTCGEDFKDTFHFCPVDGMTLPAGLDVLDCAPAEFHLTLIGEEVLARRLVNQLSFIADQARRKWPSFKGDLFAFSVRLVRRGTRSFKQSLLRPHVLSGATTALSK